MVQTPYPACLGYSATGVELRLLPYWQGVKFLREQNQPVEFQQVILNRNVIVEKGGVLWSSFGINMLGLYKYDPKMLEKFKLFCN